RTSSATSAPASRRTSAAAASPCGRLARLLRNEDAARALAHNVRRLARLAERTADERLAEVRRQPRHPGALGRVAGGGEGPEPVHRRADPLDRGRDVATLARGERAPQVRLDLVDARRGGRAEHDLQLAEAREERLERLGEIEQVRMAGLVRQRAQ